MILGIDPGLTGAMALLDDDETLVAIWDIPTQDKAVGRGQELNAYLLGDTLREVLETAENRLQGVSAVLEQVGAMPGQGVSSMFAFGEGFGVIRGCLASHGFAVERVLPNRWKKNAGLAGREKLVALTLARETWPEHRGLFGRKKDIGRAEAALIALYGRMK